MPPEYDSGVGMMLTVDQGVWKVVSALSARFLERFSTTIVDVPGDGDDEEAGEDDAGTQSGPRKDR